MDSRARAIIFLLSFIFSNGHLLQLLSELHATKMPIPIIPSLDHKIVPNSKFLRNSAHALTATSVSGYLSVYTYGQTTCGGPVLTAVSVPVGFCETINSDSSLHTPTSSKIGQSEMISVEHSTFTFVAIITTYNDANCQSINSTTSFPFFNDICPPGQVFKLAYTNTLPSAPSSGYLVNSYSGLASCNAGSPVLMQTYLVTGICVEGVSSSFYATSCASGTISLNQYNCSGCMPQYLQSSSLVLSPSSIGVCMASNFSATDAYTSVVCLDAGAASSTSSKKSCFLGTETVTTEDGTAKAIFDVEIGEKVLAMDRFGKVHLSPVIAVPHAKNWQHSLLIKLTTDTGVDIQLTADHLILAGDCHVGRVSQMSLWKADDVRVGMCLQDVRSTSGAVRVVQVETTTGFGLYTVVVDTEYIVVNGLVASPFAGNHVVAHAFYNIHRV